MKTAIYRTIFISFIACFVLCACGSESSKNHTKTDDTQTIEDNNIPPPPPPPLDTMESDTASTVNKVERPSLKPAYISFETPTYRFDTITAGEIVNYEFKFSNTGERPLEIKRVKASCGCTTPSWPFLLFAKGESSSIKARFDSKGKKGQQENTITVFSNAENAEVRLKLVGFVKE